jgi:signal transduction histidine kinase
MAPVIRYAALYLSSLRTHVAGRTGRVRDAAAGLGRRALALGLHAIDVARIHEQAVAALAAGRTPAKGDVLDRRARAFFLGAVGPLEEVHPGSRDARQRIEQLARTLRGRERALLTAGRRLERESQRRAGAESALAVSERNGRRLLTEARTMQRQLRRLARQALSAQEQERKEISRELHDEIAQALTGINVHLATLSKEAAISAGGLHRKIARTQRLVEKSVNIVHRFARDLRPALLDDLGLVPALQSYIKDFAGRTPLATRFVACSGLERLGSAKRTALYRVAQEALTNVVRHAQATHVAVSLRRVEGAVVLEIEDDGVAFDASGIHVGRIGTLDRLGLLGMRERVEMVGGGLEIDSARGRGTTIRAHVPLGKG